MNLFNHILLKIIIPSIIFSTILGCTTNKKQETNQLSPSNQITENKLEPSKQQSGHRIHQTAISSFLQTRQPSAYKHQITDGALDLRRKYA